AEGGIRDRNVTGVQTCALPIYFIVSSVDMSSTYSTPNSSNLSVTWIKYGSFDFIKISLSFFINASAKVSFQINAFFKLSENLSEIGRASCRERMLLTDVGDYVE